MDDPTSGSYILLFYALPIGLAGLLLVLFALSLGWLKELFAHQPIRGSRWMWIAVALVLVFNMARFATTNYASAGLGYVASWLLAGPCVGFAEEVLTRGFVVNLMRKAGHKERAVALVSAGVFAAMHTGNLLSGQALFATALQVVYTFAFGICMYLTLRVTGNLMWPVLLHATTDPSIFLQAGYPTEGLFAQLASMGNIPVIFFGFLAIFFIRGELESQEFPATDELSRG
ncbi:CPBP family intramembrane glutamic endopeptidase [Arthrobacter sp. MYb227]|uniref:CPBP family intramembrane glutamic endopeptidase n=1 Tax=Arthrobacter sp. MYb227 TaxID=1848601 RepID=UPI002157526C|nr:CPBP family intramembrane glutamic endopeptidase [Arthrobacter sp. MYb227]